mgnify:CR=1 FL=1|tara:strand:- start:11797 stop:12540 length:744 start_codon:yes stop_codon:yes gene_type:complete
MKLQIDRIDQHSFTTFINKLKVIDSFIYFKIKDGQVISTVYLPQRDAVKHHSVPFESIFQTAEVPSFEKELKVAFFDANRIIEAFKQFEHDAVRCEIEFIENEQDLVASTFRIYTDELEITLACSEPSLGFKDLTTDQINAIFTRAESEFEFPIDNHTINRLKSLFNLEKDETFDIKSNGRGVEVKGKTFNVVVSQSATGDGNATLYKKYLSLLDKEEYNVHVSSNKVVFDSTESETLLTISTCQTA